MSITTLVSRMIFVGLPTASRRAPTNSYRPIIPSVTDIVWWAIGWSDSNGRPPLVQAELPGRPVRGGDGFESCLSRLHVANCGVNSGAWRGDKRADAADRPSSSPTKRGGGGSHPRERQGRRRIGVFRANLCASLGQGGPWPPGCNVAVRV